MNNYEMLASYMNSEIAKIILGQTLTSEVGHSGRGSAGGKAAAETHEEVRADYMRADAALLSGQLNGQLIRWLVDYNFGPQKAYPKVSIGTEVEKELLPVAQRDQILQTMGVKFTTGYIEETYGVPAPEDGETVITPVAGEKPAINSGRNVEGALGDFRERRCGCGSHDFAGPASPDWHQEYMDIIAPMLTRLTKQGVGKVTAWMEKQKSIPTLAEFQENARKILGEAYAEIDTAPLTAMVKNIYEWHKVTDLLQPPRVEIGFGGADVQSVDFLSSLDHFYLSKFIENKDTEKELLDFLREKYLEGGEGLFGRGSSATINEFRNMIQQKGIKMSWDAADRIIDTGVQRIRNWAHVSQMHQMGVETLTVHEPTHECEFCAMIDGQQIPVKKAWQRMQEQQNMGAEAYSQWLKKRGQATIDNYQSFLEAGDLPPFHPYCHGYITIEVAP